MIKKREKKGQVWGHLGYWVIGLAVLAIFAVFAYIMKDKLVEWGSYIKNLFRS